MKRVLLRVAYDGTNYCGYQVQPNAATVEGALNRALSELLGEDIVVIGASRTDSGVHALGNVAVFDTEGRIPGEKVKYALNQRLPEDIRIQESLEVPPDFHPRRVESRKTYEYRILNRETELPTERLYACHTYRKLCLEDMKRAAAYFVGEHDFQSLCSAGSQVKDTVRTIMSLEVERVGELITIRVCGNGFLYNMVRILAGTLLEVGYGQRLAESMPEILAKRDRRAAGATAPAKGLRLVKIEYPKTDFRISNEGLSSK